MPVATPPHTHLLAPAKINLYLHVLGRQANGYHALDSLVMFADIGDTLAVQAAPDRDTPELVLDGPFAAALANEPPARNLVVRAALALATLAGQPPAITITLIKRLPVASGIGGGSADAAACLLALARLWGLPDDHPSLPPLAATLGADVPVCLASQAAYFGGIGDRLDSAPPLPDCPTVLINPGLPLPTPAVFRARSGPFSSAARLSAPPNGVRAFAAELAERRNDLTDAAISIAPVISDVLADLQASPDCLLARLSGSGATCFGLYPDADAAARAGAALLSAHPDWWVKPCRLISGRPDPLR
jgi:4-diphosphocytidyl-2-C-methyl-D-erythritol kinase